jgi:hypothetical protein
VLIDDPPLVPGWQEMDGNSVLVNGRPLNGLPLDPGKLRLVPDAAGPFANRRWLTLYDS